VICKIKEEQNEEKTRLRKPKRKTYIHFLPNLGVM